MISRNIFAAAVTLAFGFSALQTTAQETAPELTITTGSSTGTYYQFATEIAQTLPPGMKLNIVESKGSVQNLRRLLGYEGASEQKFYQLAMVQADVLEQLRNHAKGNSVLEAIVSRIKVVMPLYGEEIHAFTRQDLDLIKIEEIMSPDLTVSAGNSSGGTYLTARWLYEQLDKAPLISEFVEIDPQSGLRSITNEDTDVMFHVAGAPSKLGRSVQAGSGVRLLEIDLPNLYQDENSPYRASEITSEQYPWLTRNVPTVAVKSLLVAFDYDDRNPYCGLIEKMTRRIKDALPKLQAAGVGHPKWAEVDLTKAKQRSDLYRCSARVINGN